MKKNTKKSRILIFTISTLIVLLLMLNNNMKTASSNTTQPIDKVSTLAFTALSPITIDHDDDFITYGFPG